MPCCADLRDRVPTISRAGMFVIAVLSASLLQVAAVIRPEPRGWGSHQQLGLPACTMQQWYQIRCPACGMTTSWSYVVRGDLVAAWGCNAGGTLLALACLASVPWALGVSISGRWFGLQLTQDRFLFGGIAIIAVTLVDWIAKLVDH